MRRARTWSGRRSALQHVAECLPEICTLDCGTMNFAEADYVMTNTPGMLRAMGADDDRAWREAGDRGIRYRPFVVCQGTGERRRAKEPDALVQLCMGVPWGAPDDLNTFMAMVNNVPDTWTWSAFALGRHQMPYVAAAVLAGGNVRVGLEDNLMLGRGQSRHQCATGRTCSRHYRGHGREGDRTGRSAQETELDKEGAQIMTKQQQLLAVASLAGDGPRGFCSMAGT